LLLPKFRSRIRDQVHALVIIDPTYKLLGTADENSATDISALLNMVESLAVSTGAAVAMAGHFAKGNASAKESIDRISGSGVFARDPDSLIIFTKHEQENAKGNAPSKPEQVALSPVLGTIDVLTEVEQAELYACEEVIGTGWDNFVPAGLALARIRDLRLYRAEFGSFEAGPNGIDSDLGTVQAHRDELSIDDGDEESKGSQNRVSAPKYCPQTHSRQSELSAPVRSLGKTDRENGSLQYRRWLRTRLS
jgi:AAA domain